VIEKMAKKADTNGTPKKKRTNFRTEKWKAVFLDELARSGNVLLSSRKAGASRTQVYRSRREDPAFADQWDDAIDEAVDLLEAVARGRAVNGTDKPVYQGGVQVGTIREYSDTLLIFLLKAHRPERFRDSYDLAKAVDAITKRASS
jgi:hypothetical protein